MKAALLPMALLLALIACRPQEPAPDAQAVATASVPEPAIATPPAPVLEPVCGKGECLLPEGVTLGIDHEIESERSYFTDANVERRQMAYAYTGESMDQVIDSIEQSMQAAGFNAGPKAVRDDGVVSKSFDKEGYGKVNLWINPAVKSRNPEAKGIFGLDFPATAPVDAASTAAP